MMHQEADIIKLNGYTVEISPSPDMAQLRRHWLAIQEHEHPPVFLTWSWIETWISTYFPDLITVIARQRSDIVAIGLFTLSMEIRHRCIRSRQLRLHQTGNPMMDQVWVEYNDFIVLSEHRERAVNACLVALLRSNLVFDEIVLSMMNQSRSEAVIRAFSNSFISIQQPAFAVDLSTIGSSATAYLDSLSSNTRYQINRSKRLYGEILGPLRLEQANTEAQAHEFFQQAGEFHVNRWHDSGFNNTLFINFHHNLIDKGLKHTTLFRIKAGNTTIGVLYYLIAYGRVYFYLHGLKPENNPKLKPGLVAHSMVIQHFLEQNVTEYDFMGGYSQYKAQLATPSEDLVSVVVQRPRSRFALENMARRIKNRIIPSSR